MLYVFISIFVVVGLILTNVLALIPTRILEFGHLPTWFWWGIVAIAFSWLIGD